MKKNIKLITSLRKDLATIFIIALTTICIIDFWLIDIPEKFKGGYKLGQIIYKLSLSYISAFIFYFLVVHIKQQKDKENLNYYVVKKVDSIVEYGVRLLNELVKASEISISKKYPTKLEVEQICKALNPNGRAQIIIGVSQEERIYGNWIQYCDDLKRLSLAAINKVIATMPFLDTELVNLIMKIEDNPHFVGLAGIVKLPPMKNENMELMQSSLFIYFELIEQLEKYSNRKLASYK